jgi:hypothetical protein
MVFGLTGEGAMKYLRRLAALVLPVVAVLSVGVSASAAPNTATPGKVMEWRVPGAGPSSSAALRAPVSYIYNGNNIGIGVAYEWRGQGAYDAILPAFRRTDGNPLYWNKAEVFYIGPGHCADGYYWQAGEWRWYPVQARGPITVRVGQDIWGESVARWAVRDHRPLSACG